LSVTGLVLKRIAILKGRDINKNEEENKLEVGFQTEKEGHDVRSEALKNGGEGIIATERVGEREGQLAHVRGGLTCPSILALSPLPSTSPSPRKVLCGYLVRPYVYDLLCPSFATQ
jgi:hypothetical protein